jgi:hypothetical protein
MQGGGFGVLGPLGHLIDLIIVLAERKRFQVPMPLCSKHRRQQRWRFCLMSVGIVAFVVLTCFGVIALTHAERQSDLYDQGVWALGCAAVLALVLLCLGVMIHTTMVQVIKITKSHITLSGVSPEFISAVHLQRANYPQGLRRKIAETLWGESHAYENGAGSSKVTLDSPRNVFVVWHMTERQSGKTEPRLIGVYSSRELAERAKQRALAHHVVPDVSDEFRIDRSAIDQDRRTGGDTGSAGSSFHGTR